MQVCFDSRKRIRGSWDQATLAFDRPLTARAFFVNYISFFNSFFNVCTYNNTFTVDTTPLTIPPGMYSVAQLGATLDALVKTVNPGYSVTTNAAFLSWSVGFIGSAGTAQHLLGLADNPLVNGTGLTLPALTYPDEIFFKCNELQRASHFETDTNQDQFLYTVLVTAPSLGQNVFQPLIPETINLLPVRGKREFTFALTDSNGRKLQGFPTEWLLNLTFYD